MSDLCFSHRELGAPARTQEDVPDNVWDAIVSAVRGRIDDGSFGYRHPERCPDGRGVFACDENQFARALRGLVPNISWPLENAELPPTHTVMDVIEFCHKVVAKPEPIGRYHDYYDHWHLDFDREEGQREFRDDINSLFACNGLAYELRDQGSVVRLAPDPLGEALERAVFHTGDDELDSLLARARTKYLNRHLEVRKESLKELWDAWECLKALEQPRKGKKKASVAALLDKACSEPTLREVLEADGSALTHIGNHFRIRHSEPYVAPVQSTEQVEYFFHRLFALLWFLLRTTGRGT